MPNPIVYSERLGAISDEQFHAVATRLHLGRFLNAAPTTSGMFGQNVFVTTTSGEYVLRGAPHWVKGIGDTDYRREDRWQFTKERYFAEQLHAHTGAPTPWPMLHDETSDIFGWPYLVMPRMSGACYDERSIRHALNADDRHAVAVALGRMLAQLQRLTSPFAGDFHPDTVTLEPYPAGSVQWVIDELRMFTSMAAANGAIGDADEAFITALAERATSSRRPRPITFVHCDYKLNNLTVLQEHGNWRVSGVFDLHEAKFGDGALDLVRQYCGYLDSEPELADVFAASYLEQVGSDGSLEDVLPLYVANDRMKLWEYFTRPQVRADWTQGTSYRQWLARYLDKLRLLR